MADEVDKLDKQIEREAEKLRRVNEAATALVVHEGNAAIVPMTESAEVARQALAKQRARATKAREQIEKHTRKMRELQKAKLRALENRMRREMAAMETALEPLQEMVEMLNEAVWTVSLYLGREEQIVRLMEGEPAPADTPIVVRQLVLAMDQECAVASEEGGIDSLNYELFDKWLQEDPAHVEQVIPERKGVVACVPRYNSDPKFYADPKLTEDAMEGNRQTYFLIRNGDNLYRTWTDFKAGYHLIPRSEEFTRFFRQRKASWEKGPEYRPLEPGSDDWARAEKAASYRERHFMRVGLILEGLLHRTTVFHPLPEGGVEPSFLNAAAHEAGRVRFVADAERTLASGELEPFDKWLGNLTGQLRKGMRIIGNFKGSRFAHANKEDEYGEYDRKGKPQRLHPPNAERPDDGTIYQIEDAKPNGDLIIRYARTRETWVNDGWGYRGEYRMPKTRASCIIRPGDDFVIPLDLVDVPTMERYLSSRLERHSYTTMFPVLKRAIRAKLAEERVEAPFREVLVGTLMREAKVDEQAARAGLPELIDWYKLGNRIHRPLVTGGRDALKAARVTEADLDLVLPQGQPEVDQGKAVKLITAEFKRRLKDADAKIHDATVGGLRELHRDAVLIARMRSGRYIVLTPEEPKANVWVRERQYTTGGALREDKRWVLPGTRVQRWTVLWASERWAQWDLGATRKDHLSGPERERLLAMARETWEDKYDDASKTRRKNDYDSVTGLPAAITAAPDWSRVTVFALGYDWRYGYNRRDREREEVDSGEPGILTQEDGDGAPDPAFHFWAYKWERKGERFEVEIADHGQSAWEGGRGSFSDREEVDGKVPPPWRRGWHGTDGDTVVYEDDVQLRQFFSLKDKHKAQDAQEEQMRDRIFALMRSITAQWLQPKYDAIWAKFLDDYTDPELWHGHVKTIKLPQFPHSGSHLYDYGEGDAHMRALRALVEKHEEPWGLTVAEAVELAQDDPRFNYVFTRDETHIKHELRENKGDSYYTVEYEARPSSKWIHAKPPKDIAGLKFDPEFKLVEPWPQEPNEDEELEGYCEECGEELDNCTCPEEESDEPVEGEDFDVEGSVEEGIAALPEATE